MARELEDAKDPHQTDHAEDGQRHGLLAVALALGQLRPQSDEVRNNSHDINDIHDVFGKSSLAGAREEPHEQFKREPDYAKGLDHKERVCESAGHERDSGIRNRRDSNWVLVVPKLRQGFQAENNNGNQNDWDRHNSNASGRTRALWVLKQKPNLSLKFVVWQRSLLFSDKALIFAEFLHGFLAKLIKANFLWEDVNGNVGGSPNAPPGLIVVENGIEAGSVPVEEILVSERVKVAHPFLRVSEQRVRELVKSFQLGLEAQPRDVDDHSLAALLVRLVSIQRQVTGQRRGLLQHVIARHDCHDVLLRLRVSVVVCVGPFVAGWGRVDEVVVVIHTGEETERQRATRLPYLTSGEQRVSLSCALVCFLTHRHRPTELYKHMSTPAHGEHMLDTFPPLAQSEPNKTRASNLCFAMRARRKSFIKCPKRDSRLNNGNSSKDALSHAVGYWRGSMGFFLVQPISSF